MDVEITVRVDGREVACLSAALDTRDALSLEQQTESLKNRLGQVVLERGFQEPDFHRRHPCCCGRSMENKGRRTIVINSLSGEFDFPRNRYRCRECGEWQTPADATVCCGDHRMTRLLAKNVCQLATLEHFTRMEQLMADQHGVHVGHDPMMRLVHDVGGVAEAQRLAEVEVWEQTPEKQRRWPEPEVAPDRVHVSCDGIMFCTNETEPDPQNPGQRRQLWKQMRVGCVYWQDAKEKWHKRVVWGQEEDYLSFAASLYRMACRCGYRQAKEKIFAADGGEWCWNIHRTYFSEATGILDWYHASEHVWDCGKALRAEKKAVKEWVHEALGRLRHRGGTGLVEWLKPQKTDIADGPRKALDGLINYIGPRGCLTEYATYRSKGWQIGTGMMESTVKQLVGIRLKGPGMHWSRHGATAITALRAQDLNGAWSQFWKTLAL